MYAQRIMLVPIHGIMLDTGCLHKNAQTDPRAVMVIAVETVSQTCPSLERWYRWRNSVVPKRCQIRQFARPSLMIRKPLAMKDRFD